MCEKHKLETRVSERHKPGFGKMNGFPRAPGFPKPGLQSLMYALSAQQGGIYTAAICSLVCVANAY